MKLITRFELASRSKSELRGLLRENFNALAKSKAGSPERRKAAVSIKMIRTKLNARPDGP